MNKRKIIFLIAMGVLVVIGLLVVLNLDGGGKKGPQKGSGDLSIWIVGDDSEKFQEYLDDFKSDNPKYSNYTFDVESFDNYKDYEEVFMASLIKGISPDIFVLNNNGKSYIAEQSATIPLSLIDDKFRTDYKGDFVDKLVSKEGEGENEIEVLKGVPIGYETLGIYFDRRRVKKLNLTSFNTLENSLNDIRKGNSSITPISLGNGTTVLNSPDIISQFFLADGIDSLNGGSGNNSMKSSLYSYISFGLSDRNNGNGNNYNSKFSELKETSRNNLDLFFEDETYMIIGYPRLINDFADAGYKKTFLLGANFPIDSVEKGRVLANYNYFVLNKDIEKQELGIDLLKYMASENGAEKYLDKFPYYLPALNSLEDSYLGNNIHPDYNLKLSDFYDPTYIISSFDKGLVSDYDTKMKEALDDEVNYITKVDELKEYIDCKYKKLIDLKDISVSCEKK